MMTGLAVAQQPADIDAVNAASKAFYAALSGTDINAMHNVWAKTPYVAYAGPSIKTVIVGWDEVKKQWDATWAGLPSRTVAITGSKIQVRGALAWRLGTKLAL